MNIFKKLFCRSKSLNDYLAEANLEEKDLQDMTASIEFDATCLNESQKSQLTNEGGLELKEETANFTGMEIVSCTSSAITIISALISLEKWIGSKYFVTITIKGERQRVTVNQAIRLIFDVSKKQ